MPRAQTSGEIPGGEMSRNCVCPTCTVHRTARLRATVWSGSQTAHVGRAAHIWSGLWGNRLFPRAARAVRDDCRATLPAAWCPILPGPQQNRRAARTEVWQSQTEITTFAAEMIIAHRLEEMRCTEESGRQHAGQRRAECPRSPILTATKHSGIKIDPPYEKGSASILLAQAGMLPACLLPRNHSTNLGKPSLSFVVGL